VCSFLTKLDIGTFINLPISPINCCRTTLGSAKSYFSRFHSDFDETADFYRKSACLCIQRRMVNPFVCPSHSGIISNRMHVSSNSFCHLLGAWLVWALLPLQNSNGTSSALDRIAVYLGNGMSWHRPMVTMDAPIDPCRFQWPWVTLKGGDARGQIFGGSPLILLVQFDP